MNYSKTKVYKIWSTKGDKIYIGSTTKDYLSQRLTAHKNRYKEWKNNKYHFVTSFIIFDDYGVDNCFIELVEAKQCIDKDEKNKLEGNHIRSMICVNRNMPDPDIKERQKLYNERNKDKIKANVSKKIKCECGIEISHGGKSRHIKSKQHIRLTNPDYEEIKIALEEEKKAKKKDRKKQYALIKVKCECGTTICRNDKSKHILSQKHINLMKDIEKI
jgi:predicted GIY-YIG superfamily endonuclease